jgi:hypothetical protein
MLDQLNVLLHLAEIKEKIMSMFIEVFSVDKSCEVIINLDSVLEIAPLRTGGCNLFFPDSAAVGGKTSMQVKESYSLFKQFVLQTVTPEQIADNVARMSNIEKEPYPRIIPEPQEEKRGRGRPPKPPTIGTTASALE